MHNLQSNNQIYFVTNETETRKCPAEILKLEKQFSKKGLASSRCLYSQNHVCVPAAGQISSSHFMRHCGVMGRGMWD